MSEIPWFWPGAALSLVIALALRARSGQVFGASHIVGAALLLAVGIIVSATLTPGREALENGAIGGASCDFARFGLVSLAELASFNDTSLNVLLFIPLGVVIGMIPGSRRKYLLALGAAAMPLAIEVTQMLLPSFDRTCESADVIDNLTGFGLGLIVGAVARPRFAAGQPGVPQGRSRARDDR